jgi:hypothetical protein
MRIQFASDLHLELRPKTTFRELLEPAVAPVLALLGDIAPLDNPNLRPFMEWCSEHWDTVLWVPGCLELGVQPRRIPKLDDAVNKMRDIVEPFWNITVLDHDGMISEDGIYIFGLPFWKFPRDSGHVWHPQRYTYIPAEPSPMDAKYMAMLYNADISWLKSKIHSTNDPILILSHYGPTTWLQEEGFVGDPDKSITFPDIELMLKRPVVGWLCGHTHQSVQQTKEWSDSTGSKGGIFLATNPKGKPFENLDFIRDAVVRIDPSLFYQVR